MDSIDKRIPNKTVPVNNMTAEKERSGKNRKLNAISVGNFPLHGTKELVRMANRRSLGEAMMRHPTTAAALHPKPIDMVNTCFPQDPHR